MATVAQCRTALQDLAKRLAAVDPAVRKRHSADRTLSCTLTDLGTTFVGRLSAGELQDIREDPDGSGQIRLTTTSDALLALVDGSLNLAGAWAKGQIKVDASMLDLLRLRSLL
jgi:putative sterol carrier protein